MAKLGKKVGQIDIHKKSKDWIGWVVVGVIVLVVLAG